MPFMKEADNMELFEKLGILADSAKYDVSCSSSGSDRAGKAGVLGSTSLPGICHTWSDDGRCVSLLKILMTNHCVYDCAYCVNRSSNDVPRAALTPDELVRLTMDFYRRNYIEGLFLSSGVIKNPDHTMELLIEIVRRLREIEHFGGYIHLKGIPGADHRLLDLAGSLVDRMSLNLELPSSQSLRLLAPQKEQSEILLPMQHLKERIFEGNERVGNVKGRGKFIPAGQTTQMMIGASRETDFSIMRVSEAMYKNFTMKRVYYSAYVPVVEHHAILPTDLKTPLLREHRLYQADWLLRFYKFEAHELLTDEDPNFDPLLDPKCQWAVRNLQHFPIEVNRADYELLLRVPGIGVVTAKRIVAARRFARLNYDGLKKLGVVLKRARFFLLCDGKYYGEKGDTPVSVRQHLLIGASGNAGAKGLKGIVANQIGFFDSEVKTLHNDWSMADGSMGDNYLPGSGQLALLPI